MRGNEEADHVLGLAGEINRQDAELAKVRAENKRLKEFRTEANAKIRSMREERESLLGKNATLRSENERLRHLYADLAARSWEIWRRTWTDTRGS